jgi:CBS domain-containing protein
MAAGRDASTTALRDVMTAPAETIEETAPIETALAVMRSGAFRRLPIVNQQGKLAGIVTLDDILLALAEQLKQIGQLVEQETPQAAAESAAQKP